MDHPTTPLPEARLLAGRYRLAEQIGRGGMSTVFRAVDELLDREVAVKILDPASPVKDPAAAERFRREARATASLSHDHIVTVFDTGIDEGHAFLVMELLPHGTLAGELARRGPLPVDEVREIGAQVASALQAAHAAGLVHRDIKPGNIARADDGRIKVLDFGITRLLDEAHDEAGPLTSPDSILGTPQYLSPEQARGDAGDARSDLYALGCVLFTLLVGHPPYQGDSNLATLAMHTSAPVPNLAALRPDAPAPLVALVTALLSKDPEERPAPAGLVASRLERPASDAPTQVLGPAPRTDTPPTAVMDVPAPEGPGRRPAAAWILAAVAVAALGVGAFSLLSDDEPVAGPDPTSAPTVAAPTEESPAAGSPTVPQPPPAEREEEPPAESAPEDGDASDPAVAADVLSDAVKDAAKAEQLSKEDRRRIDEGLRELRRALKDDDEQGASDALSAIDQALSDSGRKGDFEEPFDELKDAVDDWKSAFD